MKVLSILLKFVLLFPLVIFAQIEMHTITVEGIPKFFYEIVNVASTEPGLSRLNLYIEVQYDELQFIKYEDYFKAEYEMSVVVFDNDGEQVDGKIWQEEVIVDNYDLTNSRKHYSLTHNDFHLTPDEYRISIGLMDLDSKKTGNRKSVLKLKDFHKAKLSVSDITLTDNVGIDSLGVKSIHPQVADCIRALGTELYCYFEIYSHLNSDEQFEISYKIKNHLGKIIDKHKYLRNKDDTRTLDYIKIDKNKLSYGKFLIELKVKQNKFSDSVDKIFIVRVAGVPPTISDLNRAILHLKYIAKHEEIKEINDAPQSERIERFEEFWKKKDPTPGTPENELMDEYYSRVEYSNQNFSTFKEGWQTDMGMIYIVFGTPTDIERHPFDRGNKPFEIWYYYNINRQFIFIDETGFGDYRLRNPYWRNWPGGINY